MSCHVQTLTFSYSLLNDYETCYSFRGQLFLPLTPKKGIPRGFPTKSSLFKFKRSSFFLSFTGFDWQILHLLLPPRISRFELASVTWPMLTLRFTMPTLRFTTPTLSWQRNVEWWHLSPPVWYKKRSSDLSIAFSSSGHWEDFRSMSSAAAQSSTYSLGHKTFS